MCVGFVSEREIQRQRDRQGLKETDAQGDRGRDGQTGGRQESMIYIYTGRDSNKAAARPTQTRPNEDPTSLCAVQVPIADHCMEPWNPAPSVRLL